MRGNRTNQREIRVGMRVVSGRVAYGIGRRHLEDAAVERVIDFDADAIAFGRNMRIDLDGPRGPRTVHMAWSGSMHGGPTVLWSEPLPDDDAAATALVEASIMGDDGRPALLLWIAGVVGEVAFAHLVTDERDTSDELLRPDPLRMATSVAAYRLGTGGRGLKAGDLIAAARIDAEIVDGGVTLSVRDVVTVMRDVTLADCMLPVMRPGNRTFASGNFAGTSRLDDEIELAVARSQASEALVFSWSEGDDERLHVLGSSGIAFHRQDDVEEYMRGHVPGPGLWLYGEARMTGSRSWEGEYDQDLSGVVTPADAASIERLFGSAPDLERELVDVTGDVVLVSDAIAQARAAHERETAAV